MDLTTLHHIDEQLESSEVMALKFLCLDHVNRKRLEMVKDGQDLFLRLKEKGLLDDAQFLSELLYTIHRVDLLKHLSTSKEEVSERLKLRRSSTCNVSEYRKMLYELSEDVTDQNLRAMKFLLSQLPKTKLGPSATCLDVLSEMEKQNRLGADNLEELEKVLEKCDKQLVLKIKQYKERRDQQGGDTTLQNTENMDSTRIPGLSHQDQSLRVRALSAGSECVVPDAAAEQSTEEQEGSYPMNHRPVGYCLIINNYEFEEQSAQKPKLLNRKGTERDAEELSRIFSRMHFLVEHHQDLTSSAMVDVVKEVAGRTHSEFDAFVCCILSHGERGTIMGTDSLPVQIRELTKLLAACGTLTGKPKLFFIQACQGKNLQRGILVQEDGPQEDEGYQEDAQGILARTIPIEADFLIGMATLEDYKSFRHTVEGSIYIQELCRQLERGCPRKEDILSILIKVNAEVSRGIYKNHKQMPEPRYTLRKRLVLPMD